jgi:hypothetical protein
MRMKYFILLLLVTRCSLSQWSTNLSENFKVNYGQIVALESNSIGETYILWDDGLHPHLQKLDTYGVPVKKNFVN